MTESKTAVDSSEADKKLKSSFLVIYSKEDASEFANGVITELKDFGFDITDINDEIDKGDWDANSANIMDKAPAILVIPSARLSDDGEIKNAVYQANALRVEKKKRLVPVLNATNEKQGPMSIRTLAAVNWDGHSMDQMSIDKDVAFKHLQNFLEQNLAK
jgi:hypothetical protein